MKRVGILGGMSYESTIKYYELILKKYYTKFKDYNYPEVVIFSLNFQKIIDFELSNQNKEYLDYLLSGINFLKNSGVDFIIMAANSPHSVYSELQKLSEAFILSIVDVTAQLAKRLGLKRLLLLGIKYTMQSTFYQETFKENGMKVITPIIEEQEIIDNIIFKELVLGIIKEQSKKRLLDIIQNYDVDGVILGCTELPLILSQNDIESFVLDTVEIHTTEALNFSLK
ncbi:MAG: aspartate/glutamate racemase family protein [Candidatus Thorarchaeota archaeon]